MPALSEELRRTFDELREVPPEVKQRIWDEYIRTPKGRQKLACAMIQPSRDLILRLEQDPINSLDAAEKLLRDSTRLMRQMALNNEHVPETLAEDLRRLQDAIEAVELPSRWDILMDDNDEVEF